MVRSRGSARHVVPILSVAVLVAAGCAQIFGIDGPNVVPDPSDGSADGTMATAADGAPSDAIAEGDAASPRDSSIRDSGTGEPTMTNDSAFSGDGPGPTDSGALDDGLAEGGLPPAEAGCAAIVAAMLSGAIVPPAQWARLDLSNGGQSNDLPGSGSETLAQAGVAHCASYIEPPILAADASPNIGGYRLSVFGPADAGSLLVYSNLESQAIYLIVAGAGYTGTLQFNSRSGGVYGSHSYVLAASPSSPTGGPVDAGAQVVQRDGKEFPADWNFYTNDAGARVASPWINELYDGIMASFSPSTPPVDDCYTATYTGYYGSLAVPQRQACQVLADPSGSYFVVRPLHVYLSFNGMTDQCWEIQTYWLGGGTTCSTLTANREAMDWAPISQFSIGDLNQTLKVSNPRGITYSEANTVWCNGAAVTAPDPGFAAMAWGQSGEVMMEYSPDGGLNYKLYARHGYRAPYELSDATNFWTFLIDQPVTDNGTPYVMDWSSSKTSATVLANAFCGTTDTDCVTPLDCTFVPNDGKGGSYLGFPCGGLKGDKFGITFAQGTSIPTQIMSVNPFGP